MRRRSSASAFVRYEINCENIGRANGLVPSPRRKRGKICRSASLCQARSVFRSRGKSMGSVMSKGCGLGQRVGRALGIQSGIEVAIDKLLHVERSIRV